MAPLRAALALLVIGIGSGASTACGESDDESAALTLTVAGQVSDAEDGDPIAGAQVDYTSDTLDRADTRSDSDGEYDLRVTTDEPKGHLKVQKKGYASALVPVYFDDDRITVDVALTKD